MENNLNQNDSQDLEKRARKKLQQMSPTEKAARAQKERKRTYCWLALGLCVSFLYCLPLFLDSETMKEQGAPIPIYIMFIVAGIVFAVFMVMKLLKPEDELALIRIKREIKKEIKKEAEEAKNASEEEKRKETLKKLGFFRTDIEEGFLVSKIAHLTHNPIGKILIDNDNKRVIFQKASYYTKSFNFFDISKYDIYYKDNQTIIQGRAGSALVGGLLFGATGAIVGASGNRSVQTLPGLTTIIIYINDLECPKIEYDLPRSKLQEISGYLEYIVKNASFTENKDENSNNTTASLLKEEPSKKEKLEELKQLLSEGLITQEDFEQKKKQILGL